MLRDGTFYNNLGADFFQTGTPHLKPESSPKKISKLGFNCSVTPQPVAGQKAVC